ncbi:MAG: transcriptional repressor [Chloroflexi bacterium]|nr:transcriptional repressor [Chloroflexota bacterium]
MSQLLDTLAERIRDSGNRLTTSRRSVLKAVAKRAEHFAAEEVQRQSKGVSRATVFRTLKLLEEMGILCRVLLKDGSLHYSLSRREHHHHLVCLDCGSVQDFSDTNLEQMVKELVKKANFEIEGHWLDFYGHCGECTGRGTKV